MRAEDLQDWFETELGRPEFVRRMKQLLGEKEFVLWLRWASRRGPHLSDAEREWIEARVEAVRGCLERGEPVEAQVARRYVAEQVELKFD